MVLHRLTAILMMLGLIAAGCGYKPSAPPPPKPDTCTDADAPAADTVKQAIAAVPQLTPGNAWIETARGHTRNCRLYWVQISSSNATASTPEQVVFFDRNTPLGTPTPNPKPYLTVLASGDDAVMIQYQWQVGDDPPCCPTGIGTARFQIGKDGKLKALDPVPNQ